MSLSTKNASFVSKKHPLNNEKQRILKYVSSARSGDMRTISTKLIKNINDPSTGYKNDQKNKGSQGSTVPKQAAMEIAGGLISDIQDIRDIQRSLPEVETAKDILVSSILSPKDMITEEVNWSFGGGFPAELGQELLGVVQTYFTEEYQLNDKLSTFLGNALFDRGSHILAVLPESSIDDIINSRSVASLESVQDVVSRVMNKQDGRLVQKGIFGRGLREQHGLVQETKEPISHSMESFFFGARDSRQDDHYQDIIPGMLRVTDNPDLIKLSKLQKKMSRRKARYQYMTYSAESVNLYPELTQEEVKSLPIGDFYRKVGTSMQTNDGLIIVNDREGSSRKPIGHPMHMELPHEAVIPITSPGNVQDHVGYLILIDESGHPITVDSERDKFNNMESNFNNFQSGVMSQGTGMTLSNGHNTVVRQTISELGNLVAGKECDCKNMSLKEFRRFYAQIVERDLIARFNDGVYGKNISIPHIAEVYNIMFARLLAGTMTQILYIPESLVTYIAFYYNDFGIGESLITRTKNLAALRISAIYANGQAVMKNAMGKTLLKINLDPEVDDPEERVFKIINRYMESNATSPLFHAFDPRKVTESLFRSSIEVVVDGHEGMDQTTVETEHRQGDRPLIDNEYTDNLKKDLINGLQVIPQLYDDSETTQFSSEFVTKNVLYLKRNWTRAAKFNMHLKDLVIKGTLNDGALVSEMSQLIRKKYQLLDDELIKEMKEANSCIPAIEAFLNCIEVGVPLPELEADSQATAMYDAYSSKLDKYMESYIDSDLIESIAKEDDPEKKKETVQRIKDIIKNFLLRDWIQKQNAFSEFQEMFFVDGKPNKEMISQIISSQSQVADLVGDLVNYLYETNNPNPDGEDNGDSSMDSGDNEASGNDDEFNTNDDDNSDDNSDESDDDDTEEDDDSDDEDEDEDKDKEDDDKEDDSKDDEPDDGGADTSELDSIDKM